MGEGIIEEIQKLKAKALQLEDLKKSIDLERVNNAIETLHAIKALVSDGAVPIKKHRSNFAPFIESAYSLLVSGKKINLYAADLQQLGIKETQLQYAFKCLRQKKGVEVVKEHGKLKAFFHLRSV